MICVNISFSKILYSNITLSRTTNFRLSKFKVFADVTLNKAKMTDFVFDRAEKLLEKEKMLVTYIFFFFHNVFKQFFIQGRQKLGLCGKEINKEYLWDGF